MAKTKTETRLQELLDKKDEEIQELQGRLAKEDTNIRRLEGAILQLEGGWSVPSKDEKDIKDLPLPRLEFRWYQMYETQSENDWSSHIAVYQLVFRHFAGNIVSVPLGVTRHSGNANFKQPPWEIRVRRSERADVPPTRCDLPTRDGDNSHHDAAHFQMPVYAIVPNGKPIRLDGDPNYEYAHKMGFTHRRPPADE